MSLCAAHLLHPASNRESGEADRSALSWQMGDLPVIWDNGASCHMSHLSSCRINYREAYATIRTASCKRYPIEDYGDLPPTFRSSSGEVPLLLRDIAHVRSLSLSVESE